MLNKNTDVKSVCECDFDGHEAKPRLCQTSACFYRPTQAGERFQFTEGPERPLRYGARHANGETETYQFNEFCEDLYCITAA